MKTLFLLLLDSLNGLPGRSETAAKLGAVGGIPRGCTRNTRASGVTFPGAGGSWE